MNDMKIENIKVDYCFYKEYIKLNSDFEIKMKRRIQDIPLLKNKSGPRDPGWEERLKEELLTLIGYVETLKENDNDWFEIECSDDGKEWHGECWFMHNLTKYRFKVEFEIPFLFAE